MEPDRQASYSVGAEEFVSVCVGAITEEALKNIGRELRSMWSGMESVTPKPALKATRDRFGQYHIHLNGRALMYLMIFASKLQAIDLSTFDTGKQSTEEMPTNFLKY